jgi:mycoredoxin
MATVELYGTKSCTYTNELREELLWQGWNFSEYDVEEDREALERLVALTSGNRTVPVLVEDGAVIQIGWQGRGCIVGGGDYAR